MVQEAAALVWLIFTAPCFNAALDDSGYNTCETGSQPLTDLKEVRVYRQLITGGPSVLYTTKDLTGRECQIDSVQVDPGPGAHFYVITADTTGNQSCASNRVYVGTITGVEVPVVDRIVRTTYYDVSGRKVTTPLRRYRVYWSVTEYASGRKVKRKVVLME